MFSTSKSSVRYSGAQLPVSILTTQADITIVVLVTMHTCWVLKCLGKHVDVKIPCSLNRYP